MSVLDELGLAEADLFALTHDLPESPLRERHGVLDDLGLREADLAALTHDAPERSPYQQGLDAELREEEAAAERVRREPGSVARRKEIAARIAELRNAKTGGGRLSWEEIIAALGQEFDPAQIAKVVDVHRASVREDERSEPEPTKPDDPAWLRLGQLLSEAARPTPRAGGGPRQREIAGWVQALRDPDRRGGPVPWERVRAILAEARYGGEEIAAAARSVELREDAARRAYSGELSEGELADRQAVFNEAWGDDGDALIEELAEGLYGGG